MYKLYVYIYSLQKPSLRFLPSFFLQLQPKTRSPISLVLKSRSFSRNRIKIASTLALAVLSSSVFSAFKKRKLDTISLSRGLSYVIKPIVISDNIVAKKIFVSKKVVTNISSSDLDVIIRYVFYSDLRRYIFAIITYTLAFPVFLSAIRFIVCYFLLFDCFSTIIPSFAAVVTSVTFTKLTKGKSKTKSKAKKKQ